MEITQISNYNYYLKNEIDNVGYILTIYDHSYTQVTITVFSANSGEKIYSEVVWIDDHSTINHTKQLADFRKFGIDFIRSLEIERKITRILNDG